MSPEAYVQEVIPGLEEVENGRLRPVAVPQYCTVYDTAGASRYEVHGGIKVMPGVVALGKAHRLTPAGRGELLAQVLVVSGRVDLVAREQS